MFHSFSDAAGDVTGAADMHVTVGLDLSHRTAYPVWIATPVAMWGTAKFLVQLLRYRYNFVVTVDPDFCMAIAVIGKICGFRLTVVETWSGFDLRSITGIVQYPFTDRFSVQSAELLHVYGPKAEYVGRL